MSNKACQARQAARRLLKGKYEPTYLDTLNDVQICDLFNIASSAGDISEDTYEEDILLLLDFSCDIYLETEYIPPATSPLINAGEAMPDFLKPLREIPEEYRWLISSNKDTT